MTLRSFFKYHHNQKMIELLAVELSEVIERRHLDSVQSAIVYVQDHAFFPNEEIIGGWNIITVASFIC